MIFAPDERFTVDPARLHHRHPVTPYAGMDLTGVVRVHVAARPTHRRRRHPRQPDPEDPVTDPYDFLELPDLASRAFAGSVVAANDELFAERENLIKPGPPSSSPDFGNKGKIYELETRRRREPGNDWAVVRLGVPGWSWCRHRHQPLHRQLPTGGLGRGSRGRRLPRSG